MILGALIIDGLFIGLGLLMRQTEFERNAAFGYRTTRSMQSPEAWAYANRKGGSLLAIVGLVSLAIALAASAIDIVASFTSTDEGKAAASFFYMIVPLIGVLGVIPVVESDLKKRFPEDARGVSSGDHQPSPDRAGDGSTSSDGAAGSPRQTLSAVQKTIFAILCALPLAIAACGFAALPDTIAVHFNAGGADGWAPKSQLFAFAAIMAASNVFLALAYRVFLRQQTNPGATTARSAPFIALAACMLAASVGVLFVIAYNLG